MNRNELKSYCIARLTDCAIEHTAGHQGKLAMRFRLMGSSGAVVALMFEKGLNTPANLWIASELLCNFGAMAEMNTRSSPASAVYSTIGKNGEPIYGRHSALKTMHELNQIDLTCIQVTSAGEIDQILDHLGGL